MRLNRLIQALLFGCTTLGVGCGTTTSPGGVPGSPLGTWSGTLTAASATVSSATGPTLNVSVMIAQGDLGFSGTCTQSGGQNPSISNATIQSFQTFTPSITTQEGLRGICGSDIFVMAYDPATDQIVNVTWEDANYVGTLKRQ